MRQAVLLENREMDETGILSLKIDRGIQVQILPEEARRKVNLFVHLELSTQLHAKKPILAVGDEVFWKVPIHLTFPTYGDVGLVGFISVDPYTSKIDTSPIVIEEICYNAEKLARRFTLSPTHGS